jgi:GT2 family glycosyltransferase
VTGSARVPDVSVILVNWNTRRLTDEAIASLRRFETSLALEIIVVDNASSDGSADYLEGRHPDIRVVRNGENAGFARGNNLGVSVATGEYVLLLNTDTVFHEEVLPACLAVARAHGAVVACRLLNADGSVQVSAEPFPAAGRQLLDVFASSRSLEARRLRPLRALRGPAPVDWLCGAFLLVERGIYNRLGGLSEDIFMYGEDTEFAWRARRAGVPSWHVPGVSIVHLGGGGNHGSMRSLVLSDAGRLRAFAKIRGALPALLFRGALIARSLLRGAAFGVAGALKRDAGLRSRGRNHLNEVFVLSGLVDARRFI